MSEFCGKCGSRIDRATGKCPRCDAAPQNYQNPPVTQNQVRPTVNMNNQQQRPVKAQPQRPPVQPQTPRQNPPQPPRQKTKEELKAERAARRKLEKAEIKAQKKRMKKENRKAKRAAMSFGEKVKDFFKKLIAVIIVLALLAGSGTVALVYFDKVDIPVIDKILVAVGAKKEKAEEDGSKDDVETPDDVGDEEEIDFAVPYEPPVLDAESLISQYGTIKDKVNVIDTYENILTEEQAVELFTEKGFEDVAIMADYKINGEYIGEYEISYYSDEQHPAYRIFYQTSSGELWNVTYMNGNFFAVASSHNIENNTEPEIILAQSDTLTNYDNNSNQYFNYIPDASKIKIIKVSAINAETLENYKF